MRRTVISLVMAMLLISFLPVIGGSSSNSTGSTRSVFFTEVGESSFDQTSAPTFISAVNWNNGDYTDLLFNGYRLFKNNGPPNWDFTLQTSVFNGSVSGARNGVWADWDGDGDQDLYQGCGPGTADRFWENQGAPDFKLEDVSASVFGSWQNVHPNTGNAWGDIDRDGDLDLFIGNGEDWNDGNPIYFPDYFLRNENGISFTEVSSSIGIRTGENFYSRGITWGDYNNDNWQDAYVSHYRIMENHLFENQKDGTFDEVGQEKNCSGTYTNDWYYDATAGNVYGQSWWGPNWGHTIGSSWADFNRDGNLDLWTSDFVHKYVGYIGDWYDIRGYVCDDGNLYINDGAPNYEFVDYRNTSGIPKWPIGGSGTYQGDQTFSGVTIGDYDNDGWEDIYIPQVYGDLPYTTPHLYRNKGVVQDGSVPDGTTFEDVTTSLGINGANTYANLWVDYDNDGDLDLVTGGADTWNSGDRKWENYRVRLYKNGGDQPSKWLKIELVGTGKNPQAIGAKVMLRYEVNGEEKIITREVRAGTGHAHQDSNILFFGLGWDPVDGTYKNARLEVHWPNGIVMEYGKIDGQSISYDRKHTIEHPWFSSDLTSNVDISDNNVEEDEPFTITVTASHEDQDIVLYKWDLDFDNFFDIETQSGSINISYPTEGLKHVRCRAYFFKQPSVISGGMDIYPIEIDVHNREPRIEISDRIVMMDEEVRLEAIIIDSKSDLMNMSWSVKWGDGSFEAGMGQINISHYYTEPGNFSLEVSADDRTDKVTDSGNIMVQNIKPWGWVEPADGNETEYPEDDTVYLIPHVFDTASDDEGRSYRWDFGDGTVESDWHSWESGIHRYERYGQYSVVAYVKDKYGSVGELMGDVRIFNPSPELELINEDDKYLRVDEDDDVDLNSRDFKFSDTRSDQDFLLFQWDHGDGNISEWGSDPKLRYSYERSGSYFATCTVKDDDGATDIVHVNIDVDNVYPKIDEITSQEESHEDDIIEASVRGSDTNSDRNSLNYELEIPNGDILSSSNGTFVYSFPKSGYYEIIARIIDDDGAKDEKTFFINILNLPPTGIIYVDSNSYDEDQAIYFQGDNIQDTPGDLPGVTISWNFGDHTPIQKGSGTTHTYTKKGRYDVQMIIDDGDERTIVHKDIIISNPTPHASISVAGGMIGEGRSIQSYITFNGNDSSDNPSDLDTLLYLWDFGDGEDDEGRSVSHEYKTSGIYTVTLQVMDDDGSIGEDSLDLEIILEDTSINKKKDPQNNSLLIAILGVGLVVILVLVLGGILLLKKRQQETVPLPPDGNTMALPSRPSLPQRTMPVAPDPVKTGSDMDTPKLPPPTPPVH